MKLFQKTKLLSLALLALLAFINTRAKRYGDNFGHRKLLIN